jgi:hypothetical protein
MRSFIASAFVIAVMLIGQQLVAKTSEAASLPAHASSLAGAR